MRFLVDDNLGNRFTILLNQAGYNDIFVGSVIRGFPDEKILEKAESEKRVIITDDKDFGWLIFRWKMPTSGVILFRTSIKDADKRLEMIKDILDKAEDKFIVVEEGRIRIREL